MGTLSRAARTPFEPNVVLLSGKDYAVEVNASSVTRQNKSTGQTRSIDWSNVTSVQVVAIDRFPIGGISFMLYSKEAVLEVPIESDGAKELLSEMQRRLKGLDNRALGDSMSMLHGFREIWVRQLDA
jgi:hypothetical protein